MDTFTALLNDVRHHAAISRKFRDEGIVYGINRNSANAPAVYNNLNALTQKYDRDTAIRIHCIVARLLIDQEATHA